jgi:DNA-binding transcriptional regulator YiaG
LTEISAELGDILGIDFNKSQIISFLIKNYGKTSAYKKADAVSTQNRTTKSGFNYMAQIIALKDKLNVSYPRLAQIIGIPESTLKKYANGTQQPKAENEQLLKDALLKYGIK